MDARQSEVIIAPIINEKSIALTSLNQFTFEVKGNANKIAIAAAVEQMIKELYPKNKSKVVRVNTCAIRGRLRSSKRQSPAPHDSKKAIVHIEGDAIELFHA